jgi:hypothetical protein
VSVSKRRALSAGVTGTAAAVAYPLLPLSNFFLLSVKGAVWAALSAILFYKKCGFFKGAGAFLLITFFFGGALFAVGLMVHADVGAALRRPVCDVPVGFMLAAAFVTYKVIRACLLTRNRLKSAAPFVYDTEIDIFARTVSGKGFLDTGNGLYDSVSGLPIVVLGIKAALGVLDAQKLKAVIQSGAEVGTVCDSQFGTACGGAGANSGGAFGSRLVKELGAGAHYASYSTVGDGGGKILVLKPDEIRLYSDGDGHIIKDVMIGLAFCKIPSPAGFDILLHPDLIKNSDPVKKSAS